MMTRRVGGWSRRLPYLVWSYDYSHASAGPKALHRLCHELNEAGETAYIGPGWVTNPEWNTPTRGVMPPEYVAVYPEIVSGNPWNAPRVARWVLNTPGKLGGDREYAPDEMVFAYQSRYLDGVPILHLPTIETDIYTDRHEPRSGALYFIGKGYPDRMRIDGASEITLAMRQDRHALADALNHAAVMYSMDDASGMNGIAQLCGCPVIIVPTGERLSPVGFREEYEAIAAAFPEQLRRFVEITQAVGVPA